LGRIHRAALRLLALSFDSYRQFPAHETLIRMLPDGFRFGHDISAAGLKFQPVSVFSASRKDKSFTLWNLAMFSRGKTMSCVADFTIFQDNSAHQLLHRRNTG
jgi:hypothetical protein